jgi:hypothetical protein
LLRTWLSPGTNDILILLFKSLGLEWLIRIDFCHYLIANSNNQNNVYTEDDPGYWVRDGDRLRNLDKAKILPGKTQPATAPTEPRPVTLPANTPKKRREG